MVDVRLLVRLMLCVDTSVVYGFSKINCYWCYHYSRRPFVDDVQYLVTLFFFLDDPYDGDTKTKFLYGPYSYSAGKVLLMVTSTVSFFWW